MIPPIAFTLVPPWQLANIIRAARASKRQRIAVIVVLIVLVLVGIALAPALLYLPDFAERYRTGGIWSVFEGTVLSRLQDIGEIAFNLPAAKAGARLLPVFYLAGLIVWLLIARGWLRSLSLGRPLAVFFVSYCAILFIWPFQDARFWIPVVPIVVVYAWIGLRPLMQYRAVRIGLALYLTAYAGMALLSFAYSTRIAFSGGHFPETYGSGTNTADYRKAWSNGPVDHGSAADLIRRYGGTPPHLAPAPSTAPHVGATTPSASSAPSAE